MKTYSTREAAKLLGITMMTLHRRVVAKKISVPPVRFRAWKARDVERVRKQLLKIKNGRRRRK